MKRNTKEKIFAILALVGILAGVVSTGLLYLFSPKQVVAPSQKEIKLSDEQINQLKELTGQKNNSGGLNGTGELSGSGNDDITSTQIEANTQTGILD